MKGEFSNVLSNRRIGAVAIGASAGGISALLTILAGLPRQFQFPVIIVLHRRDEAGSHLTDVFAKHLPMPVKQADDKMPAEAGVIYFAGAGYHLSIEGDRTFSLSREDPVLFSRPAIDIFLASAADVYRSNLVGILLTGASADGAIGMATVGCAGGLTVVQDPLEAEMSTMPRSAIGLRAPDLILPLSRIRELLTTLGTL